MYVRIKRHKNVGKALSPMPDIAKAQWIAAMMMETNEEKKMLYVSLGKL